MLPGLSAQQGYDLSQANVLNTVTQGDAVDPSQQPQQGILQQADEWRRRKLGSPTMQGSMGGSAPHSPIGQHVQFAKQQTSMGGNPYITQGTGSFEQPATPAHADKRAAAASGWATFLPQQQAASGSSSFGGGLTDIAKATPQTEAQVAANAGNWREVPAQTGMQFSGDEQSLLQAVKSAGGTPMDGLRMILEQRNKAAAGRGKKEQDGFLTDTEAAEGGKHYTSDTAEADVARVQREKEGAGEYKTTERDLAREQNKSDPDEDKVNALKQQAGQQFNMANYGYGGNPNATDPNDVARQQQQRNLPQGDGDQITPDEAQEFLRATGGDPNAARQLAAQAGHKF